MDTKDSNSRIEQLELRVAQLEQQVGQLLQRGAGAAAARREMPIQRGETDRPGQISQTRTAAPKPPVDWEHLIARVWLPRIFIAVLLLGVLWGFTAAVNAGFITEPVRCLLGAAAAALMYWQGEKQALQGRHAIGQVLLGGSVAVLLLSLFAAHMLYELIPAWLAFTTYVLTVGAGLWMATRHRSQALVIVMIFAGYLLPVLIESKEPNIWTFAAYETIFSIAMLFLCQRFNYRLGFMLAFGVLHLSLLAAAFEGEKSKGPVMTAVLAQHAVLFALYVVRPMLSKASSRHHQTVNLLFAFGVAAAWAYGLLDHQDTVYYQLVIGVLAVLYSAASYWQLKQGQPAAVYMSAATFAWFLLLLRVLEDESTAAAVLAEGALALILGWRLRSRLQQITGGLTYAYGFLYVLAHPLYQIISIETFGWVMLLGTAAVLYVYLRRTAAETESKLHFVKKGLLWAISLLLLVFITQLTEVATRWMSTDMQHLLLSAVWALYAIVIIVLGIGYKKRQVRLAGILFLFITLLKIIFADLPDVSVVVRALLFIGVGGIGIFISRLFYKVKDDQAGR